MPLAEPRRQQTRTRETRAAILAAARALALAEGLGALRAERIAAAAGIAKGTVFAHFPDMGHLTAALSAERIAALPPLPPVASVEALVAALRPLFDLLAGDGAVAAALSRFAGPEGAELGVEGAVCAQLAQIAGAIAALQARGAASPGAPDELAEGVLAFVVHAAATARCAGGAGEGAAVALLGALVGRWLAPAAGP